MDTCVNAKSFKGLFGGLSIAIPFIVIITGLLGFLMEMNIYIG